MTDPSATRSGPSFRDPDATLFSVHGRMLRAVSQRLAPDVDAFLDSSFYLSRRDSSIVATSRPASVPDVVLPRSMPVGRWLEHDPIEFPTFPFEWPFSYLRAAALLTLDLLFDALADGWTLKDGAATNVQFRGSCPVFVDVPSFVPYREDEPWAGYRQFCEHFLAPLLVEAKTRLDPRPWLRGCPCGLDLAVASRLLPRRSWLDVRTLLHIHLHALALRGGAVVSRRPPIPRHRLRALVASIRSQLASLRPQHRSRWSRYDPASSYDDPDLAEKSRIVREFLLRLRPRRVLDVGSNRGDYSLLALQCGTREVVGVDSDPGCADLAASRVNPHSGSATFLVVDVANSTASPGWLARERSSFESRLGRFDCVLCLALVHHLVFSCNLPLAEIVAWLAARAPRGLVEFVPSSDPRVHAIAGARREFFQEYDPGHFESLLRSRFALVRAHRVGTGGRIIFEYCLT